MPSGLAARAASAAIGSSGIGIIVRGEAGVMADDTARVAGGQAAASTVGGGERAGEEVAALADDGGGAVGSAVTEVAEVGEGGGPDEEADEGTDEALGAAAAKLGAETGRGRADVFPRTGRAGAVVAGPPGAVAPAPAGVAGGGRGGRAVIVVAEPATAACGGGGGLAPEGRGGGLPVAAAVVAGGRLGAVQSGSAGRAGGGRAPGGAGRPPGVGRTIAPFAPGGRPTRPLEYCEDHCWRIWIACWAPMLRT